MKEENILSAYLGFQANMDGDEGELVQQKIFFSSNNKLKYGKSKSVYETIVILVSHNENKTYIFQNAPIHPRPHPCSPENFSERTVYLPLSPYTFARNSMFTRSRRKEAIVPSSSLIYLLSILVFLH